MESILSYINVQQIVNFIAVVEQHGFQAASEYLNLTQSSVSKSIRRLEDTLGFSLFLKEQKGSRTFRDAHLTEEGKYLYQCWAPAMREIENAYLYLSKESDMKQRVVRVGYANTTNPDFYLWQLLDSISEAEPGVNFNIESSYRSQLLQGLAENIYDIVFVPDIEYYSINPVIMDFHYAAIDTAQIMVPKTHSLYNESSLRIEDLDGQKMFLFSDGTSDSPKKVLQEFFDREHISPEYVTINKDAFNVNNAFFRTNAMALIDHYFSANTTGLKKIPLEGYYNGILCVWKKNRHRDKYIRQGLDMMSLVDRKKEGKKPVVII